MIGPELALRTDGSMPMPGTVDSAAAGRKQIGILRSPTFEITTQNIHLRMKATADATVHVVIDNYQMAPFSDLLFKGTLLNGSGTGTPVWQLSVELPESKLPLIPPVHSICQVYSARLDVSFQSPKP